MKTSRVKQYIKEIRLKKGSSEPSFTESAFVEHYRDSFDNVACLGPGLACEFMREMPCLDEKVRESLEKPLSVREIKRAIEGLTSGKLSGPDGLGGGFYKVFSQVLASILYTLLTGAYKFKNLTRVEMSSNRYVLK